MTEKLTMSCEDVARNKNHPEVLRAEAFLREFKDLCNKYNVEWEYDGTHSEEWSEMFITFRPQHYGFGFCGLIQIEDGKWVFSKPWGG